MLNNSEILITRRAASFVITELKLEAELLLSSDIIAGRNSLVINNKGATYV